jgi:peptidyl-prolyl cis-trans isomerase SurA
MTRTASCSTLILASILLAVTIIPGTLHAQESRKVLAEIGDYTLTLGEFERQFIRNNGGEEAALASTPEQRKDFLDLLIKYRLKVLEAMKKGYNEDEEILSELKDYRNSLAIPYLTERELVDPKIEDLYKRRLTEVRAAHILIRPEADSLGRYDSLAALQRAKDVIRMAQAGENWDSLVVRYSMDKGTTSRGGDLFYFTAGMTVPAFDDAVYSLKKPGDIYPEPVQTMFGYHVVKLLDRRPARGEIQVSHILVRIPQDNPTDTLAAYKKIHAILDSLNNGVDFKELAKRNSEDPGSGANGGDLGWNGRRRFVPEFELVAFDLPVGGTSGVVRTMFGYHIIRVEDERPPKSFEESRQELKELYRRYSYEQDNADFLAGISRKHGVKVNDDALMGMINNVDTVSTTSVAGWFSRIPEDVKKMELVSMNEGGITVDEAIRAIERSTDYQNKPLNRASLRELAELVGQHEALMRETADLEQRYPEFASLMQEYREGVLLFRAEQENVWNKVTVDEDSLKQYWEQHRAEYNWPDRVQFSEIFVTSDSMAKLLRDSLDMGASFDELASRHTARAGYRPKNGDWGLQPYDTNELTTRASNYPIGYVDGPIKFQYGYSIIKVTGKEDAREKTFDEAQSEVSSKYQEFESKRLEKAWIDSLRNEFGVEVEDGVLDEAFNDLRDHGSLNK